MLAVSVRRFLMPHCRNIRGSCRPIQPFLKRSENESTTARVTSLAALSMAKLSQSKSNTQSRPLARVTRTISLSAAAAPGTCIGAHSIKISGGKFEFLGVPNMEFDRGSHWGPTARVPNHGFADVDADDLAICTNPFGHSEYIVAKTAAEVERTLAGLQIQRCQHDRLALLDTRQGIAAVKEPLEEFGIFGLIDDREVCYVLVSRHAASGHLFKTKCAVCVFVAPSDSGKTGVYNGGINNDGVRLKFGQCGGQSEANRPPSARREAGSAASVSPDSQPLVDEPGPSPRERPLAPKQYPRRERKGARSAGEAWALFPYSEMAAG